MRKTAFSLTELSIVMVIIGIIASSAISAGISKTNAYRQEQTLAKLKIIEESIAAFVALNRRLPCPADATLNIDTSTNANTYGIENFTGNTCTGSLTMNVTTDLPVVSPAFTDTNIVMGSLPVQSLLLPKELMVDGWGNKFSFVVSRGIANQGISSAIDSQEAGVIKIKNFTNPSGPVYVTNAAAYVIISHGPSGAGAYTRSGTRIPNGSDSKKTENSHTSGGYNEVFVLNIPNAGNTFDDIVRYKTKTQLVYTAGAVMSGNVCNNAYTALDNSNQTDPNNLLCFGTLNSATGTVGSSPDCNMYMLSFAELVRKRCLTR